MRLSVYSVCISYFTILNKKNVSVKVCRVEMRSSARSSSCSAGLQSVHLKSSCSRSCPGRARARTHAERERGREREKGAREAAALSNHSEGDAQAQEGLRKVKILRGLAEANAQKSLQSPWKRSHVGGVDLGGTSPTSGGWFGLA